MRARLRKMNWKLVAGIVFVILMIGVAVVIANPPANRAAKQTQQTVVVQRGNLTAAVTGSGTIAAESTIELSFETSGTVKEVLVSEGDTVQASQVLAKLDDRTLLAEITSAQAKLTSAQAQFGKTKQGATAAETASVQAALQRAQAAYDKALKEAETADLDVTSAKLTMDKAQVAVGTAQAAYDRIGGASNPMIGMTSQAKDLQNATLEYQNAVTTYQTKFQRLETSKKSTIASAKSTLETAKYNLANLQVRSEDLAIDQASIDQADQALKQAQINLENAVIKAPFAGVVTAVNVVTGTRTSNVPVAIKMMNVNPLHVTLKLSENDVVKIQLGQSVKLTTDSLKDWQTEGQVSYIAPSGESTSGVVTYVTRVNFTTPDARIKVGMTSNLDIITAQRNNVLVVPNTALLPKGNSRIVQVVGADGKAKEVEVQTGLSDGSFTEIAGGVTEGTRIVALPSSGAVPSSSPFGP